MPREHQGPEGPYTPLSAPREPELGAGQSHSPSPKTFFSTTENRNTKESISCERCKSRKLKCGRQQPSCQRCANVDAICKYVGRRKPGFPAGQRQFLEEKIRSLENEVQRLGGQPRSSAELSTTTSSNQSGAALQNTIPRNPSPPESLLATLEKTSRVIEREPPADLVLSAASLYFRHIHSWLPFLDTQRVFSDMALLRSPPPLYYAIFGSCIPYSHDPRLDRKSSDSFWTFTKRRTFVDILEEPSLKSLEALTVLILDLSGMTNGPQVWGALSIAIKFSVQLRLVGNRVFRISAEDRTSKLPSNTEEMQRRRLFWAIYALDSYIIITTGHPSSICAENIEYFLPSRNETWRGSSALGLVFAEDRLSTNQDQELLITNPAAMFSYQLELLDISRNIHTIFLECTFIAEESVAFHWLQKFIACSEELSQWFQNLPPSLALNLEENVRVSLGYISPTLAMLQIYYHALVLHLHSLVAYVPAVSSYCQFDESILDSKQRCENSLKGLSALVSKLDKNLYDRIGWPFSWAIWTACRYILVRNHFECMSDMSSFYTLLECLKTSARFWQIAGKYWSLLSQATVEFDTATISAQDNPPRLQNVLSAITDLRTPTSDLEDQARPDPIMYNTTPAQENHLEIGQLMSNLEGNSQIRMGGFGDANGEYPFNMSANLTSDYWYSSLLFSSSGFQQ